MADSSGELTIHIDGDWDAKEFAGFFQAVSDIFDFESLICAIRDHSELRSPPAGPYYRFRFDPDAVLFLGSGARGLGAYTEALGTYNVLGQRLSVVRINYASPGPVSFAGAGDVIRELRETVLTVIDANHRKKMNRIAERKAHAEAESVEVDVEIKRIELFKHKADVLRMAGLSDEQVAKAIADAMRNADALSDFRQSEKITAITDGRE